MKKLLFALDSVSTHRALISPMGDNQPLSHASAGTVDLEAGGVNRRCI